MQYDTVDWLLALAPLLIVLGLMVSRGWDTVRAGVVGWGAAVILAATRFGAGIEVLGWAQVKAFLLTSDVLLIIWAALVLYYIVDRAGALTVIARGLAGLTGDPLTQVLLLGWVFASYLQGVGGFGVPMAITAPLLIGVGVPAVRAVVIPALGHGWAVTFGSLAASFIMLTNTTGLPAQVLAGPSALMLGALGYLTGLMCAHVYDGWRGVRRSLPYVLVTGTAMGGVQYLAATHHLWTIAAISGGAAGVGATVLWIRAALPLGRSRRIETGLSPGGMLRFTSPPALLSNPVGEGDLGGEVNSPTVPLSEKETGEALHPPPPAPSMRLAVSGYVILVALALVMRGIQPVKESLDRWAVAVDIPATTTARGWLAGGESGAGFGIPGHAGMVIFYSGLIAYLLYRRAGLYKPGVEREIARQSGQRTAKAGLGHFLMVGIAFTMARAGMMHILADGLSSAVPAVLYPFVAPLIGALGAFVTGSNVNSNAVFGLLQVNMAELLSLSVITILAAQTGAAAVISVMSPAKVAVGCSTVGANEGEVLRALLGYGAVMVLFVGALAWIATTL